MTQAKLKKTFYSNGKLLITGEYTVLDGAKALALPTSKGQFLEVTERNDAAISWKSFDADGSIWYESEFTISAVYNNTQTSDAITNRLIEILHHACTANTAIFINQKGYDVVTSLTFPRQWGLGTSSTLINNIASWFNIDAFTLLNNSFGGSGYDIACAKNNTSIVYHLENNIPIVEQTNFNPSFSDKLYFIYLNKKQNSRSAIAAYREKQNNLSEVISQINNLTDAILKANDLKIFINLIDEHSKVMSAVLQLPTVKEELFPDFNGSLKSLGAWGGDFILAAAEENPMEYFKSKGFETVVPYSEMILKNV